ncbi:hypothetical protein BKA00_007429 [Actinomadura coerulea]|uniref:DUF3168 domain-containing protein n=1 Tax=Actinomadura coerulea TaxID=46159 RepID=A0A7X0L3D9_9ACTN|nr:DUF3168 domain-containing protein [Actinomadura coerulea]MBB6400515.1 hypothetical protein [Actinomadura coerulea]GGQ07778.1 hypothetical protein GCM10010187_24820 [Actinomadura coerulea]
MTEAPYAALTPVQAAVYAALTSDLLLTDMITGVFDDVPEDVVRPYVAFGESTETPDNAHGQFGRETVLTLDIWSEYGGFAEANAIAFRLNELLDQQPLVITGCRHVYTAFEFAATFRDPDKPDLRHAFTRFRIVTSKE